VADFATQPMCLSLCILSAILLGVLYLFFGVSADRLRLLPTHHTADITTRHFPWCLATTMASTCGRLDLLS
jgi:hypothetical protein